MVKATRKRLLKKHHARMGVVIVAIIIGGAVVAILVFNYDLRAGADTMAIAGALIPLLKDAFVE